MGKTKDLSKDCKNIVLNLFNFFQLEKAGGRPLYVIVYTDCINHYENKIGYYKHIYFYIIHHENKLGYYNHR
jgi:hypothetical protein